MKSIFYSIQKSFLLLLLSAFLCVPILDSHAALGVSVPATAYCAGDSIIVKYSSAGLSFGAGNLFVAQLSNATGNFGSFTNIGNVSSTNSTGQISCTLPSSSTVGTKFRIRVVATSPSTVGSDNGMDIAIHTAAYPNFQINDSYYANVGIGAEVTVNDNTQGIKTCTWDFGPDAIMSTSTSCKNQKVAYQTKGRKTIHLVATDTNGCSASTSNYVYVYSCAPIVPSSAVIVSGTSNGSSQGNISIWVKSGGAYHTKSAGASQAIYVSSGGSVVNDGGAGSDTVYLESFASYDGGMGGGGNILIYDPNAGVSNVGNSTSLIPCSALTITSSVLTDIQEEPSVNLGPVMYPNPSNNGKFAIQSSVPVTEVVVVNSLGQKEIHSNTEQIDTKLKGLLIVTVTTAQQRFVRKVNVLE